MRLSMVLLTLALGSISMGCGDDSPPVGGGSSGSSGTGDSTGTPTPMTMPTTNPMTDGMTSSSTGPDPTTGEPTTSMVDSSGTDTGTGSGSSDTGPGEQVYPPCEPGMDPICPPPYMVCYDFEPGYSACTAPCMDAMDCPQPTSGDAPAVCAGPGGDQCLLDCAGGETCPDGMECVDVAGMFMRCLWAD